jgi:hypothetical protein
MIRAVHRALASSEDLYTEHIAYPDRRAEDQGPKERQSIQVHGIKPACLCLGLRDDTCRRPHAPGTAEGKNRSDTGSVSTTQVGPSAKTPFHTLFVVGFRLLPIEA